MWVIDSPQILSVGIALLTLPVLVVVHAAARRYAWGLFLGALAQAAAWFGLFRALMGEQGFGAIDFVAGLALMLALWLAWFQVYSTLCRGFSMQLLVELERAEAGAEGPGTRMHELAESYGEGRGMDGLMEKRLVGLEAVGLLRRPDAGNLESTPSGRLVARIASLYKNLVGIGAGG